MSTDGSIATMDQLRMTITRMQPEFKAALPQQIPAERFVRTTLTAIQMNPDLMHADRKSLLGACMKAAQDGLMLDGREAAAVIFRTKDGPKVQYMPMLGGVLKKLRNSGDLSTISANVVYEKDEFDYELGDNERIYHKPVLCADRGRPIAVYAICRTKDDAIYREVMSVDEVERVRAASRARDSGPWVQWWSEMARKTVIRRLAKRLPSSADIDQVLEHDNEQFEFRQERNVTPVAPEDQNSALREAIGIEIGEEDAEVVENK